MTTSHEHAAAPALVIGASGLVGAHLLDALRRAGSTAPVGTFFSQPVAGLVPLDLRDAGAVQRCVAESGAAVVYLTGALTHVDRCETHPDESFAVNVAGVRHAAACGVRVVYFSTDYVFDGAGGPYRESDPVHPLSVYGRHKLLAERALPPDALIVRTTGVFGPERAGKNFVYRLRATLAAGQTLRVPSDQLGTPTYAPDLAAAAVALERRGACGVYHLAGAAAADRYRFAVDAARVLGVDPALIQPVTTAELRQAAPRPLRGGLLCERARTAFGIELIDYHEGLRRFREAEG